MNLLDQSCGRDTWTDRSQGSEEGKILSMIVTDSHYRSYRRMLVVPGAAEAATADVLVSQRGYS